MRDPLLLARMRATRITPVPLDASALSALRVAADLAGRQVIDVLDRSGGRVLMLGWPTECDPASIFGPDIGSARPAPPSVLLTLAACIRCCWQSTDEPLYPGCAVAEERVLDALERFTRSGSEPGALRQAARPAWKSALRYLRACGFLAPDQRDLQVRLGPEIAVWNDADLRQLRDRYEDLPGAGSDEA